MQEVWVRSLVGKLKSHIPQGQKNQNMKQKQYYNKFNKRLTKKMILSKKKITWVMLHWSSDYIWPRLYILKLSMR